MERSKELYRVAHQESDNKVSNVTGSAVGLVGSTALSYFSIYFPPAKLVAKPWVLNGIRAGAVAASAGFGYLSGSNLYKWFSSDNRERSWTLCFLPSNKFTVPQPVHHVATKSFELRRLLILIAMRSGGANLEEFEQDMKEVVGVDVQRWSDPGIQMELVREEMHQLKKYMGELNALLQNRA